jgi:hypothetical protein
MRAKQVMQTAALYISDYEENVDPTDRVNRRIIDFGSDKLTALKGNRVRAKT